MSSLLSVMTGLLAFGAYGLGQIVPGGVGYSVGYILTLLCGLAAVVCRAYERRCQRAYDAHAQLVKLYPLRYIAMQQAADQLVPLHEEELRRQLRETQDELNYVRDELEHQQRDNEELNLVNLRELEYQDKAVAQAVKLETVLLQDRIDELKQECDELHELLAGRKS